MENTPKQKIFGRATLRFSVVLSIIFLSLIVYGFVENDQGLLAFLSVLFVVITFNIFNIKRIVVSENTFCIKDYFWGGLNEFSIDEIASIEIAKKSKGSAHIKINLDNGQIYTFYLGFIFFEASRFYKFMMKDERFTIIDRFFM